MEVPMARARVLLAALAALPCCGDSNPVHVVAQSNCLDYDQFIHSIASFATPSGASDVEVSGSYAYVCDAEFGLQIEDISDPRAPVSVGSLDTPGRVQHLTVAGGFAYLSSDETLDGTPRSLQVIDVAQPTAPTLVASIEGIGAGELALLGSHLILA